MSLEVIARFDRLAGTTISHLSQILLGPDTKLLEALIFTVLLHRATMDTFRLYLIIESN